MSWKCRHITYIRKQLNSEFYQFYRHNMTTGLGLFFAFYLFVCQPALLGWLQSDNAFFQLAWFNAWVFFIAWIISALIKSSKNDKSNKVEKESKKEIEKKEVVEELVEEKKEEKEDSKEIVEEIVEEKRDEDKGEKVMKESVSIPKIVQPLSSHPTKRKRKKERKFWQWIVFFITLLVACVMARALWEFLWIWWIAVALFVGWILYLLIGKIIDVNWFYKARTLFTNWLYILLILWGIGYWIYVMQQADREFNFFPDWRTDKVVTQVKDWFKKDGQDEDISELSWNVYVFEWTGEIITEPTIEDGNDDVEWTGEDVILPWGVIDIENDNSVEPEQEVVEIVKDDATLKQNVTMWDAIKHLLAWATLSTSTKTTFKNIAKTSELYPYFKTAQEKGMVWTDVDPNKIVGCDTYITMKWLLEGWNVWSYVKSEIKTAYWNKAKELWKLNGCEKWVYLTVWNL